MANIEDRYYELEDLISNLNTLIGDLETEDDINTFQALKYDYEKEFEELEPKMQKMWDDENWERNIEYIREVL